MMTAKMHWSKPSRDMRHHVRFSILCRDVIDTIGPAELRVTRSQIAFRRRVAFAWAWLPARYLRGQVAPLVLTLSFRHRDASPRWKEIVEAAPGRFTHHVELYAITDIDDEVRDWLRSAWMAAAWDSKKRARSQGQSVREPELFIDGEKVSADVFNVSENNPGEPA